LTASQFVIRAASWIALDNPDEKESSPTKLALELRVGPPLLADALELNRDTGSGREVSIPDMNPREGNKFKGSAENEFAQLACNISAMALEKEGETSVELLVRR
jgi:hypothetical protein